jgi:hypothetical protein
MSVDIAQTANELIDAIRSQVTEGWDTISTFATTQSKMLATQSAWITESRINGSLKDDDDLFDFFVAQLKDSVESLARSVAALTILTLEKTWNAIVGVLWGAINTALHGAGLGFLPLPPVPQA